MYVCMRVNYVYLYVCMCVCEYYSDKLADKFPFIVKES